MILMENEIGQAILNYLTTQPYNQVFHLIDALRHCKKVDNMEKNDVKEPSENGNA